MPALRPEEEWVRSLLQAILRVPVEQRDDGSRPQMHDLTIAYPDRPHAALEVTAAADAEMIEFWRHIEPDRWQETGLVGGWSVACVA